MSVKVKVNGSFADIGSADVWVRPTDWLELPTVLSTDKKFVGPYAVFTMQGAASFTSLNLSVEPTNAIDSDLWFAP